MDRNLQEEFATVYGLIRELVEIEEKGDKEKRRERLQRIKNKIETRRPGSPHRPFTS